MHNKYILNVYNEIHSARENFRRGPRCLDLHAIPMMKTSASPPMLLRTLPAVKRGPAVRFLVDGQAVDAFEGESVAAALYAAGMRELRRSPRDGAPRGLFCMMGSCQECLVWVGARKLPSCQVAVATALEIETLSYREERVG
jgi:hypothetical protein